MDIKQVLSNDKNTNKVISRWSNGAIHFEVEYDEGGDWKSGRMATYYMNGQLKSVCYQEKGTIDGELIYFEVDKDTMSSNKEEMDKFLNE